MDTPDKLIIVNQETLSEHEIEIPSMQPDLEEDRAMPPPQAGPEFDFSLTIEA